jgi:diacylglycerol O-acyltransferase
VGLTTPDIRHVEPRARSDHASSVPAQPILALLAMESGKVPQQFAVILLFDQSDDLSLSQLQQVISDRILAVPRLRQRLIKVPAGLRALGVGGRG